MVLRESQHPCDNEKNKKNPPNLNSYVASYINSTDGAANSMPDWINVYYLPSDGIPQPKAPVDVLSELQGNISRSLT